MHTYTQTHIHRERPPSTDIQAGRQAVNKYIDTGTYRGPTYKKALPCIHTHVHTGRQAGSQAE